jgi:Skp family chaperone for outer membrane proteins
MGPLAGYSDEMASTRTIIVAILVAAACQSGTKAFGQTRSALPIAYISVQRILAEADEAKAGAKELEALRAARAQELTAKKRNLDDTKLQIANAGGMFSASKRQQLTELAKRQESELQQATQQANSDFQELQKKVREQLTNELNAIIRTLAQQRGVLYVLNQDAAVVLAPTSADWTSEVLQRLNIGAAQRADSDKASAGQPPKKP